MKHILILFAVLMPLLGAAQREDYVWVMGNNIIDFKTNPPTVIANDGFEYATGLTSIADRQGNLEYWRSGENLYDKNSELICKTIHYGTYTHLSCLSVFPFPGDNSKYIFLSLENEIVYFHVLDASREDLSPVVVEGFASLPHGNSAPVIIQKKNSRNYWVIQEVDGCYNVYSLTNEGLSFNSFKPITDSWKYGIGWSHVSSDQTKIFLYETSFATDFVYPIIDFDPENGVIKAVTYHHAQGENFFGYTFTENDKYLYFTYGAVGSIYNTKICRCPIDKLHEPDALKKYRTVIYDSQYNIDDMKLAPNGNILFKTPESSEYLGVISNPESENPTVVVEGLKMALPMNAWSAFPKTYKFPFGIEYTNNCGEVNFSLTGTGYNSVKWNFGDGSAEVNGVENPVHKYVRGGRYAVTVTVDVDGNIDEYSIDIDIANALKKLSIICE